jgi:predicted GNAT family acetyltransferase
MYFVRFSTMRAVEHFDPRAFEQRAGKWMLIREAENSYMLGHLSGLVQRSRANPGMRFQERFFTVEDNDTVVAAAILFGNGCLVLTWATDEIAEVLCDHLLNSRCTLTSVFGPGHVSWKLADRWATHTNQRFDFGRSERVYQMTRVEYEPPVTGRLLCATDEDRPIIRDWVKGFIEEAEFELVSGASADTAVDELIRERALFLWKQPEALAMAAWLSPTPNGGCINFVYTPTAHRGQGYAKAVCSALAAHQLAGGKKYCFIMTDTEDPRTNRLYQSIGARTLCELLRCTIHPKHAPVQQAEPVRDVLSATKFA